MMSASASIITNINVITVTSTIITSIIPIIGIMTKRSTVWSFSIMSSFYQDCILDPLSQSNP